MAGSGRAGGSAALAELIDTYGAAAFDHDLRLLGVDLVDVIDGRFSAARALWLLEQLGEGSATAAAVTGGPAHRPWTTTNLLLRRLSHAVETGNWQRGGGQGKRPQPIDLPPMNSPRVAGRGGGGTGGRRRRGVLANRVAGRAPGARARPDQS